MSATLVICKPDAVERGLTGEIVARFERKGLRVVVSELRVIDAETAKQHYQEHADKPFFDSLVAFITRSPSLIMTLEAPAQAGAAVHAIVRTLMGSTNPAEAAPGTIRGDFATEVTENLVHGSDSPESAAREIELFFGGKS